MFQLARRPVIRDVKHKANYAILNKFRNMVSVEGNYETGISCLLAFYFERLVHPETFCWHLLRTGLPVYNNLCRIWSPMFNLEYGMC